MGLSGESDPGDAHVFPLCRAVGRPPRRGGQQGGAAAARRAPRPPRPPRAGPPPGHAPRLPRSANHAARAPSCLLALGHATMRTTEQNGCAQVEQHRASSSSSSSSSNGTIGAAPWRLGAPCAAAGVGAPQRRCTEEAGSARARPGDCAAGEHAGEGRAGHDVWRQQGCGQGALAREEVGPALWSCHGHRCASAARSPRACTGPRRCPWPTSATSASLRTLTTASRRSRTSCCSRRAPWRLATWWCAATAAPQRQQGQ